MNNRIFTIRFYRPDNKDPLSWAIGKLGWLVGVNGSLAHVAIEWEDNILSFGLFGVELYRKETEAETIYPDVILYFETTDADIKVKYLAAKMFILNDSKVRISSVLRWILFRNNKNTLLCTDFVEFLAFFPQESTVSLTPVELLKKYASKSKMMYVSDYGRKVIENERIQVSYIVPEMQESGQPSSL